MFGKLLGRNAKEDETTPAVLSALGPYAELGPAELELAANLVDRIQVKAGLLTRQLPTDRRVFLERGSVQIQTHTGYVLLIKAGTAQARYPIPFKPDVVSL